MLVRVALVAVLLVVVLADELIEGSGTETTPAEIKCEGFKACSSSAECGTGGSCLGAFVGTCNCNACVNFWMCKDDAACGGLRGACDAKAGVCRCWEALEKEGMHFTKAAMEFCNVKKCASDASACLGLPCSQGRCVCARLSK